MLTYRRIQPLTTLVQPISLTDTRIAPLCQSPLSRLGLKEPLRSLSLLGGLDATALCRKHALLNYVFEVFAYNLEFEVGTHWSGGSLL